MINLQNYTKQELIILKKEIEEIINKKNLEIDEIEFDFEAEADARKGIPYAAKVFLNEEEKLGREFFKLTRIFGKKNDVIVRGKYKAREGEIIELRTGGSWKNDYRKFYIVKNGILNEIGYATKSDIVVKTIKFLKGEISELI